MCKRKPVFRPRTIATEAITGHIVRNEGTATAVAGLSAPVGSLVEIQRESGDPVAGEVIGFREELTLICPLGDLTGVEPGSRVRLAHSPRFIQVGAKLKGRAINALGVSLDGKAETPLSDRTIVNRCAAPVLDQPRVDTPISTGVRAIDGLLPCGFGQRMGIFCETGSGEDLLLAMLARHCEADVNVIALIGRPGRETLRTLRKRLGSQARRKTIVVVATDEEPALVRLEAAATATAIAEYFRDRGKNVLLAIDSLTGFAAAQRDIGLAAGETLNAGGYPASVSSALPRLLERAGRNGHGSITAFYTVQQENGDRDGTICDMARSLLDGHIVLSHSLDSPDSRPAIDLARSVSRTVHAVASREHLEAIGHVRSLLAVYQEHALLIHNGAYTREQNPLVDQAIRMQTEISRYLRQELHKSCSASRTRQMLLELAHQRPAKAA